MGLRICAVCDDCGEELVVNPVYGPPQPKCDLTIYPSPCPVCLKKDRHEAYQDGHLDGKGDGVDEYLGKS